MKRTVAIVGGGLAGIAAAIRLAGSDWTPIVLETSRRLGGRATSFVDPRSGEVLDNCQHVVLGCCTNVLDLYDRLGVLNGVSNGVAGQQHGAEQGFLGLQIVGRDTLSG